MSEPKRKVISISVAADVRSSVVVAACNDGTIWIRGENDGEDVIDWQQIQGPPGTEPLTETEKL